MALYLLKSAVCLVVFLLFYKLFLERMHWHLFKRFYLLSSIALAFSIPLITYTTYIVPAISSIAYTAQQPIAIIEQVAEPESTFIDTNTIFLVIYSIGVLLFGIRFARNLNRIIYKIRYNPKHKINNITNVLLKDKVSPHTFLRYIFLNKEKFEQKEIPQEVFWHEETHARQKHSLDILFVEFVQVFFWCNPILYFVKKSIKLNHEFLADEAVLNKGTTPTHYQNILLAFSSNALHPQLANAINYSSIKKRFTVMKTKTSKKSVYLRSLLLLPILAALIYSFSTEQLIIKEVEKEAEKEEILFQEREEEKGATPEMMQAYQDFITKVQTSKVIKHDELKRHMAIYEGIMTVEQRATVEKYPEMPSFNLAKTKAKQPTQQTLNAWKNKENYAVWLDGKVIENQTLERYAITDIAYYMESFVYKNARSPRFPQSHQVSLYTKQGFEKNYKSANIIAYRKAALAYSLAISVYLKSNGEGHSELRILAAEVAQLYKRISKEDKEKNNILPPPPVPAQKLNKGKTSNKGATLYHIDSVQINKTGQKFFGSNIQIKTKEAIGLNTDPLEVVYQEKATKKMVATYNALAKKYRTKLANKGYIQIKKKDVDRMQYIYNLMTDEQKKDAETFPDFPPMPPPVLPPDAPEIEEIEIIEEPEFEEIEEEIEIIEEPNAPEALEIIEALEVVEIQTPPPPPPPPNPLDLVIKMAKKGAKFYYNDQAISSDRAIEIVKKNKKINITLDDSNAKNPILKLYSKPIQLTGKKGASQASTKIHSYAKKLAKNNAQFYYNNKSIPAQKGLAIIKENKVVVETYPWTNKTPEVKIFDKDVYQKAQIAKKAKKQIKSRK